MFIGNGKNSLWKTFIILFIMTLCISCKGETPITDPLSGGKNNADFVIKTISGVMKVSQITGAGSPNKTDEKYSLYGADLGSMMNMGDKTYFVFGDSFGYRSPEMTGGGGSDWRSNTMAYTTDSNPADGITLEGMIENEKGHASELLPSLKLDNDEMTKIPTHGIAIGTHMYLYYMSVKHWGDPGKWDANYASMAKSDDNGQTWVLLDNIKWPGDSSFIQVSPYQLKINEELTEVYFWAIPSGRFGGVKLMKVETKQIEELAKYVYYTGMDQDGKPIWSSEINKAVTVVEDTVGELSVIWNPYLERWIMMYLKEGTGVVLREGITPWGPWSDTRLVADKNEFPGLYGPYMNPKYMTNNGKTIYFSLSLWDPYNVFWMKADLSK